MANSTVSKIASGGVLHQLFALELYRSRTERQRAPILIGFGGALLRHRPLRTEYRFWPVRLNSVVVAK
jgi:hypothetical protein